jgi:hypothetical protein
MVICEGTLGCIDMKTFRDTSIAPLRLMFLEGNYHKIMLREG